MNEINIDHIGDDLAKAYSEGYEQGKFDMMQHTRGEWYEFYGDAECSVCNYIQSERSNFCPRCGANMRGEHNDE